MWPSIHRQWLAEYWRDYMTSNQLMSAHRKQAEMSGCDTRRGEIAHKKFKGASNELIDIDRPDAYSDGPI